METDTKPHQISSIASNTPEQCQGDVDMLEHKDSKISLLDKVPSDPGNIDNSIKTENLNEDSLTISKSMNELTNQIDEECKTSLLSLHHLSPKQLEKNEEKSPIKQDEQENEMIDNQASTILTIDNSVLLSPPKSEPQGPIISPTDENTTASNSPPSESHMSPSVQLSTSRVPELESTDSKIVNNDIKDDQRKLEIKLIRIDENDKLVKLNSQNDLKEDSSNSTNTSSIEPNVHSNEEVSSANEKDEKTSEKVDNELKDSSDNYINLVANGTIPKSSGKPSSAAALSKKLNSRGRPKQRKGVVAVYQSEISDNAMGIKLCIKKADQSTPAVKKSTRKRSKKPKYAENDSETDELIGISSEKRKKKEKANNNTEKSGVIKQKKSISTVVREPVEQSAWGSQLPEHILSDVFSYVVESEGCLPTLFRLGQVCSLWRKVSLEPRLWSTLDWGSCIKDRYRTEAKLKWLIENRMRGCKELNISNWKVSDIQCVLYRLAESCPGLVGITLSGWKGFTSDHLSFLVREFKKLERIDLSSINVELHPSKSGVALSTLCTSIQSIGERLTHLHLAHNRLAGVPQIITALSTYCPNLTLLDLSNVQTVAISHGILHVEKLQKGCQKLKVLRITNSHITLSAASLQEQMESPGFPNLEELSVASLVDESRSINDDFIQRILKTSTKLKLLDVRGCARLTHDSLIRLPAWDLKHLFLSGCSVTRDVGSGLELIASKWAHSLIELDLAWANVQESLDNALKALAEKGAECPITHLNLCGSSVSVEAVKEILTYCPLLYSINLSSCRGLPRGVKRFMNGPQLKELREVLEVTLKTSHLKLPVDRSLN